MEIQALEKELIEKNKWLFMKLTEQKDLVRGAAQTEHDYRIALAKEIVRQRVDGTPATIMSDICKGKPEIAKFKLERDIAKGMADACKHGIKAIQQSMSGLQSLISTRKEEMKLL